AVFKHAECFPRNVRNETVVIVEHRDIDVDDVGLGFEVHLAAVIRLVFGTELRGDFLQVAVSVGWGGSGLARLRAGFGARLCDCLTTGRAGALLRGKRDEKAESRNRDHEDHFHKHTSTTDDIRDSTGGTRGNRAWFPGASARGVKRLRFTGEKKPSRSDPLPPRCIA